MPSMIALTLAVAIAACRAAPLDAPHKEPSMTSSSTTPTTAASLSGSDDCTPPRVEQIGPVSGTADATILLLHGYGADAASMVPIARALSNALPTAVVLVPDGCEPWDGGPGGRQWFSRVDLDGPTRTARTAQVSARLSKWIDATIAARALPADRVVFSGFSQGAMLAMHLGLHHVPAARAVVAFSGRFVDASTAQGPAGLPVMVIHGDRDAMIPFAEAAISERELTKRGAVVTRVDRPGMAHEIDMPALTAATRFLRGVLGK
jgi:phospholipase/carboxylesterase